jgi:hypothetical protein
LKEGQTTKVKLRFKMMQRQCREKRTHCIGSISEFVPSPNGKKLQLFRGEILTNADGGSTKRITNTPEQERHVQWSPDNKR